MNSNSLPLVLGSVSQKKKNVYNFKILIFFNKIKEVMSIRGYFTFSFSMLRVKKNVKEKKQKLKNEKKEKFIIR